MQPALTFPRTRANTTPVGAFPAGASPYHVLDMCGNVAEWTSTRMPSDTIGNTGFRVIKGASGVNSQRYNFRCAARNFSAHEYRAQSYLGFRCGKDISPLPPLTPIPTARGPHQALYRKERIRVGFQQGQHTGVIHVPYFPDATFLLNIPEVAGSTELGSNRGGPTQWTATADGSCQYTFVLPGKTEYHVKLAPGFDHVDLTIRIRNLTNQTFTGVFTNTCFNPHGAPYFFDPERVRSFGWTDQGATNLFKIPFATRSSPGETLYGSWPVEPRAIAECTPTTASFFVRPLTGQQLGNRTGLGHRAPTGKQRPLHLSPHLARLARHPGRPGARKNGKNLFFERRTEDINGALESRLRKIIRSHHLADRRTYSMHFTTLRRTVALASPMVPLVLESRPLVSADPVKSKKLHPVRLTNRTQVTGWIEHQDDQRVRLRTYQDVAPQVSQSVDWNHWTTGLGGPQNVPEYCVQRAQVPQIASTTSVTHPIKGWRIAARQPSQIDLRTAKPRNNTRESQ